MQQIVVLGAGIAGLSVAYHAGKIGLNPNVEIFEEKASYGGLLDNFTLKGFRFDNAVHLSFTKDDYVRSLFNQTPYITHKPNPYNFENGKWFKHPIQNNLFPLPAVDKVQAIKSFFERPTISNPDNYQTWLFQQYGEYIAKRFPLKYTRKYWTVDATRLSTEWIGNRMYRPSLEEVLLGAMTDDTPNTYYTQEMRYPQKGGFKSFLDLIVKKCSIHTNKKAKLINAKKKYIEFATGEKIYYERLVSTIPLPEIVKIIKDIPDNITIAANQLWATSIALISIGFNRPDIAKYLWFYIYDENLYASRVYSPNLKSLDNVPKGCSSLQFEIYFSKFNPLPASDDLLIEYTINSLQFMNLTNNEGMEDIIITDCRIIPYANVVFEQGMREKRQSVIDYLKSKEIYVAGRFGEWDYLWSDQSLLSGKKVIDSLFNITPRKFTTD